MILFWQIYVKHYIKKSKNLYFKPVWNTSKTWSTKTVKERVARGATSSCPHSSCPTHQNKKHQNQRPRKYHRSHGIPNSRLHLSFFYILHFYPKDKIGNLICQQNPESDEKLSHDSLPGGRGSEWKAWGSASHPLVFWETHKVSFKT